MPSNDHKGDVVLTSGKLCAIACETCGFAHLDPLPTQLQLDTLYADEYYQTYNAGWFQKEESEQWYWRKVYDQRLDYAYSLTTWRILYDHGAGCGWFIKTAKRRNWAAYGYEPNYYARLYSDLVLEVDLRGFQKMPEPCGIAHCSLVLEHVADPLTELRWLYDGLMPGGVICVVVPSEFHRYQVQLARRYGYNPLHQHHVNYFTHISIQALLQRAGFDVVRVAGTFPMEWFTLHGINYVKYPKMGRYAHWLRMVTEATALTVDADRWERRRDVHPRATAAQRGVPHRRTAEADTPSQQNQTCHRRCDALCHHTDSISLTEFLVPYSNGYPASKPAWPL